MSDINSEESFKELLDEYEKKEVAQFRRKYNLHRLPAKLVYDLFNVQKGRAFITTEFEHSEKIHGDWGILYHEIGGKISNTIIRSEEGKKVVRSIIPKLKL